MALTGNAAAPDLPAMVARLFEQGVISLHFSEELRASFCPSCLQYSKSDGGNYSGLRLDRLTADVVDHKSDCLLELVRRRVCGVEVEPDPIDALIDVARALGLEAEPPNCDTSSWTFARVASHPKVEAFAGDLTDYLRRERGGGS